MAATKGNQFWKLRSKHGRDKLFATSELLWDAACEYFEWCEANPLLESEIVKAPQTEITELPIIDPKSKKETKAKSKVTIPYSIVQLPKMRPFTLTGLCLYLDCNTKYFNDFENALQEKPNKGFSEVITRIRETLYTQKFEGAAAGFLNPNIIARDLGLVDKTQSDATVNAKVEQITGMVVK